MRKTPLKIRTVQFHLPWPMYEKKWSKNSRKSFFPWDHVSIDTTHASEKAAKRGSFPYPIFCITMPKCVENISRISSDLFWYDCIRIRPSSLLASKIQTKCGWRSTYSSTYLSTRIDILQFVGGQHWPMQSIKKNTHHSLGSIVVASGNFSSESKQREAVPRNKKQSWSTVDFKESI